LKAFKIELLD